MFHIRRRYPVHRRDATLIRRSSTDGIVSNASNRDRVGGAARRIPGGDPATRQEESRKSQARCHVYRSYALIGRETRRHTRDSPGWIDTAEPRAARPSLLHYARRAYTRSRAVLASQRLSGESTAARLPCTGLTVPSWSAFSLLFNTKSNRHLTRNHSYRNQLHNYLENQGKQTRPPS